jgi:hypothetical protein
VRDRRPADEADEPAGLRLGVGADDLGGPLARVRSPAQLRESATSLAALAPDERPRRFDPDRMTALVIYPDHVRHRPDERHPALDHLLGASEDLQTFVAAVVAAGDASGVRVA